MFKIALIGRPNVGKSTIYNRIIGVRSAIVDKTPGVTRDRKRAEIVYFGARLTLIDSGGIEPGSDDIFRDEIRRQTEAAIEEADLLFLTLDGASGLAPGDHDLVELARRSGKPTWALVNKIDDPADLNESSLAEFCVLGIDRIFPISAERALGIDDLIEEVTVEFKERLDCPEATEPAAEKIEPIKIAVVGAPNVGKSTLINQILGEERMLTSPFPGATRDAIDSDITIDGRPFRLIDTAGIRRKARVTEKLEKFSVIMARKAIERADIALLMIDAANGYQAQDAKIGAIIERAGKGVIIALNKWDRVEKDDWTYLEFERSIREQMKFLSYAPLIFISAAEGIRTRKIFERAIEVNENHSKRIPTGELNRFLERLGASGEIGSTIARGVKIYYGAQARSSPPTFVLTVNHPDRINFSGRRFLINQLRQFGQFESTPIRLILKPRSRRAARFKSTRPRARR